MPKVSIITINFNNEKGLEKTVKSVLSQTVSDFEFIIIDGASNDNSVNIIKQYADKINYWVSEKDRGIYDAQNKGIVKAAGDYLLFLNSGDCFYDENVLKDFYDYLNKNHKKVIYGNSNFLNDNGSSYSVTPPAKLDLNFWYANTINHQAIFTHIDLFKKYGNFNTEYKLAADFDFLFKLFIKEPSEFLYFNQMICDYDNTGLTSKGEHHKIIFKERKKILQSYLSKQDFRILRESYFKTISVKKKYSIIISENNFLRITLKPFYRLYTFFK